MIRSLHTVNRHMNVLQKRQENASANISNINTPGYKFQDIVQSTLESQEMFNYSGGIRLDRRQDVGGFVFGNQIDEIYRDFTQGSLNQTDKDTDIAIAGSGFFTVELDDGQFAYTRNGNFKIDDENRLVTLDGYPVLSLGDGGQISYIFAVDNQITVSNTGYIPQSNSYLLISEFGSYDGLASIGNTYFTGGQAQNIQGGDIRQGFLEMSNVELVDAMIDLIEISREFESNQKVLHASDETLNKAVNEIGRV